MAKALEYYDDDEPQTAVASFLQEAGYDENTRGIVGKPGILSKLWYEVKNGRDAFKGAMLESAV